MQAIKRLTLLATVRTFTGPDVAIRAVLAALAAVVLSVAGRSAATACFTAVVAFAFALILEVISRALRPARADRSY